MTPCSCLQVHSMMKNKQAAVAHFDHIEVTHAGQAFRMGRYPIHFHMEGNVNKSYVEGCAIHRSFNRAITVHGTQQLRVERNVVYDILGEEFLLNINSAFITIISSLLVCGKD